MSFHHGEFSGPYSLEGLNDFTLTSEYLEKDIVIDPQLMSAYRSTKDDGDITTIKIFKETGIDEIGPESLKHYIQNNKDIKKVVIEKVSLEEASRISFLFEPDQKKRTPLKMVTVTHGKDKDKVKDHHGNPIDLSAIEDRVNHSFLSNELEKNPPLSQAQSLQSNLTLKTEASPYGSAQQKEEFSSDELAQEEYSQEANGKLSYEKDSLTRKRSRKSTHHYYRAHDHMELFKVGSSYLRDFQSGVRSMGFSSYNLKNEGEKTIFGISAFFNYHNDLKICVITNRLEDSFYASILEDMSVRTDLYNDEWVEYELYHAQGNDFIEYSEIGNVECQSNHSGPEYFIDFLLEKYDLILWDLPTLEIMNSSREIFFPIVRTLESLTLIVGGEVSKGKELDALVSYYQKYQVPIKGVLFSDPKSSYRRSQKRKIKNQKKEASNGLA